MAGSVYQRQRENYDHKPCPKGQTRRAANPHCNDLMMFAPMANTIKARIMPASIRNRRSSRSSSPMRHNFLNRCPRHNLKVCVRAALPI